MVLAGALTAVAIGCGKRVETAEHYDRVVEMPNQTTVLSSTPERDSIAYERSQRDLSGAHWQRQEQKGPRPNWERDRNQDAAAANDNGESSSSDTATSPDGGSALRVQSSTPTVDDTVISRKPQRTNEPVDEADLPVTVVELPDGMLRIIWQLRSYGGSNVTASRDGGTTRRAVAVNPPDLAPLAALVQQHVGEGGTVTALPRENTLVITAAPEMRTSVLDLLAKLDVPPRQVEITAKIFEVSHDFDFQQGARMLVNRIAANDGQHFESTFDTSRFLDSVNNGPYQGSVISLMRAFQDAGVTLEASFQLLAETGLIRVVSSPRMTVAAGQTGYLLAGQELPIQSTQVTANATVTTTTYKPVGVQLYITPQAVGEDRIKLHTISVVSSVAGFVPLPTLSGANHMRPTLINPIIESREAETAVTIDDGHTLVISGLRMIRTTTRENKIPGLGDLPIIGWMFKNHRSQQQMTDLYFFVTPTLL